MNLKSIWRLIFRPTGGFIHPAPVPPPSENQWSSELAQFLAEADKITNSFTLCKDGEIVFFESGYTGVGPVAVQAKSLSEVAPLALAEFERIRAHRERQRSALAKLTPEEIAALGLQWRTEK